MSGLFMSSRGGRYAESCPLGPKPCLRDHGRCLQGKMTINSFLTTYELDTLK